MTQKHSESISESSEVPYERVSHHLYLGPELFVSTLLSWESWQVSFYTKPFTLRKKKISAWIPQPTHKKRHTEKRDCAVSLERSCCYLRRYLKNNKGELWVLWIRNNKKKTPQHLARDTSPQLLPDLLIHLYIKDVIGSTHSDN